MQLGETFERFLQRAPISVMYRALLERARAQPVQQICARVHDQLRFLTTIRFLRAASPGRVPAGATYAGASFSLGR